MALEASGPHSIRLAELEGSFGDVYPGIPFLPVTDWRTESGKGRGRVLLPMVIPFKTWLN